MTGLLFDLPRGSTLCQPQLCATLSGVLLLPCQPVAQGGHQVVVRELKITVRAPAANAARLAFIPTLSITWGKKPQLAVEDIEQLVEFRYAGAVTGRPQKFLVGLHGAP